MVNCECVTVGELMEQLKEVPKDYKIKITLDYGSVYCNNDVDIHHENKEIIIHSF